MNGSPGYDGRMNIIEWGYIDWFGRSIYVQEWGLVDGRLQETPGRKET